MKTVKANEGPYYVLTYLLTKLFCRRPPPQLSRQQGHLLAVISYMLAVIFYLLAVIFYPLAGIFYLLAVIFYPLAGIFCLLAVIFYPLSFICYRYMLSFICYLVSAVCYRLSAAINYHCLTALVHDPVEGVRDDLHSRNTCMQIEG